MKRKPNVAKTLLDNSVSAMLCAIEIHNKPNITYRYPTVTMLILNSWELALKSYIYKILGEKKIIKKDNDGRYKSMQYCINKIFIGEELKVYKSNLEIITLYRNMIVHSFSDQLDEIIFSIINKNIELYGRFLRVFLNTDIGKYGDNLILLPIGFKKPFNPAAFLGKKGISKSFSNEIGEFLSKIVLITKELDSSGIQETVLIPFKIDLSTKNKIKNPDIIARIEKNSEWGFSKETKLNYSIESGVEKVRSFNLEEIEQIFTISYKSLVLIIKENLQSSKWSDGCKKLYKIIKNEDNYQKLWMTHPINKKIYFHKNILDFINKQQL